MDEPKLASQFFAGPAPARASAETSVWAALLMFALYFACRAEAAEPGKQVRQSTPDNSELIVKQGVASRYSGDQGIENDPNVVFAENFEEGSLDAVKSRWESVQNIEIMSLSTDVPLGSGGKHSLLMAHIGGKSTGGHLYRRLLPGYEQLYVRFYVKFDRDCYPIHHFVHVGGYNPSTPWP